MWRIFIGSYRCWVRAEDRSARRALAALLYLPEPVYEALREAAFKERLVQTLPSEAWQTMLRTAACSNDLTGL
jgi:hypothetical protein